MDWINSAGGPLVCATEKCATDWRGVNGSSTASSEYDYDRACTVVNYLGIIPCGSLDVLVLGDEPLQTKIFKVRQELIIARWVFCDSYEQAGEAIVNLQGQLNYVEEPIDFRVDAPYLYLFDAASDRPAVSNIESNINQITPGTYRVTTEIYKKGKEFEFLLHRFMRGRS